MLLFGSLVVMASLSFFLSSSTREHMADRQFCGTEVIDDVGAALSFPFFYFFSFHLIAFYNIQIGESKRIYYIIYKAYIIYNGNFLLDAFVSNTIRSITEKSFLNCYNTVIIRLVESKLNDCIIVCHVIYIVHYDCKSMLLIWTASITAIGKITSLPISIVAT